MLSKLEIFATQDLAILKHYKTRKLLYLLKILHMHRQFPLAIQLQ